MQHRWCGIKIAQLAQAQQQCAHAETNQRIFGCVTSYVTINCFDAEVTGEGDTGIQRDLQTTVSLGGLKELPGGNGGKVLTLNILPLYGEPKLVMWASTTANFSSKG